MKIASQAAGARRAHEKGECHSRTSPSAGAEGSVRLLQSETPARDDGISEIQAPAAMGNPHRHPGMSRSHPAPFDRCASVIDLRATWPGVPMWIPHGSLVLGFSLISSSRAGVS